MTKPRAKLVGRFSAPANEYLLAMEYEEVGTYQDKPCCSAYLYDTHGEKIPVLSIGEYGLRRWSDAMHMLSATPFPVGEDGLIVLAEDSFPSPVGEWKRGWMSNLSKTMFTDEDARGASIDTSSGRWTPIEYRIVGEKAAGRDERLWGVLYRDGGVISFEDERKAREALDHAFPPRKLVRLTVEPVEESDHA